LNQVKIYDTTLRDGSQAEGIVFSVEDKLRIARKLDGLGVHYIEGGWPGSNVKDLRFFERARRLRLENARVCAFGSTRRARSPVEEDRNLRALLDAETEVVTIFGKSWDLHVTDVLRTSLEENLAMIRDSVAYLKAQGLEVIYDAEHFFDGYRHNPEYAMETLRAAEEGRADWIVLCETNGGALPLEVKETVGRVRKEVTRPLGIHAHNDAGMAVANSVVAVQCGAQQVQGTVNGYGERSGNADLCSVIPALKLKLGIDCVSDEQLKTLTETSLFVSELANLSHDEKQPYVGESAFAHKGGVHADAVRKNPATYEHVSPELVGNRRRILISEQAGRSAILDKVREYGFRLDKDSPETGQILEEVKRLEYEGYQFEAAEGSFDLLVRRALGAYRRAFDLRKFEVRIRKEGDKEPSSEALVELEVHGKPAWAVAEGNGPVNALDNSLREILEKTFPVLREMRLEDYKVRVLEGNRGTGAKVVVLVESTDGKRSWGTVGVSENIIEASWQALVDSFEYKLSTSRKQARTK